MKPLRCRRPASPPCPRLPRRSDSRERMHCWARAGAAGAAGAAGQEVGKVAKAAPVLISKCLELLIHDLVKSASKVCKSKNAATVNVNHLREAVSKENTFDFLQEVRVLAPWLATSVSAALLLAPPRAPAGPRGTAAMAGTRARACGPCVRRGARTALDIHAPGAGCREVRALQ